LPGAVSVTGCENCTLYVPSPLSVAPIIDTTGPSKGAAASGVPSSLRILGSGVLWQRVRVRGQGGGE
jgi:hypothetical protein